MEDKKFTVRDICFEDTFTLSEILEKADFQTDLNYIFDEAKKQENAQAYLGVQLFLSLGKKWHKAKDEIIRFVSDITDTPIEIIKKLKFKELQDIFAQLFANEDIQAFIGRVMEEQK